MTHHYETKLELLNWILDTLFIYLVFFCQYSSWREGKDMNEDIFCFGLCSCTSITECLYEYFVDVFVCSYRYRC